MSAHKLSSTRPKLKKKKKEKTGLFEFNFPNL